MGKVVQRTTPSGKPTFDPERAYKWEPGDIFEITGEQYATIYHALSQEMKNVGGAPVLLLANAYKVVEDILRQGVEQGVIMEQREAQVMNEVDKNVKSLFDNNKKAE